MPSTEFVFNPYPIQYRAKYNSKWEEVYVELPNKGRDESRLPKKELYSLLAARNHAGEFPLVNYTTQYAFSCFEGLKAFPNINGSLFLFRPEKNALRFYNSMKGMYMPPFPKEKFLDACIRVIDKSNKLGFGLKFESEWKRTQFERAQSVYLRPFTYSEPGFGVTTSLTPWVIIVATEVGNYFEKAECPTLEVSKRVRASENGTGWIKCSANYVVSALAKKEATDAGYNEALFLDGVEKKYVEECSSCNVFFVMKDNSIVTPELSDTILPGITRESVITLAKDMGYDVKEQKIDINEVVSNAKECFATGTAVGVSYFGKIVYKGKTTTFGDGTMGQITKQLRLRLKNIQHGLVEDKFNWLVKV